MHTARQKMNMHSFGRLSRRITALTLVLAMSLPTMAFAAGDNEGPAPEEYVEPTITIEANAVVDRWYDRTNPDLDVRDYLTGDLEVAIRVKTGELTNQELGFNSLGIALKYSPILTPYKWTLINGIDLSGKEMTADEKKAAAQKVELGGTSVFDKMANMQTLKSKQITTAVGQVSGAEGTGGYLYMLAQSDRPIELVEDTVLAVVTFRYELEDYQIVAAEAANWLDPASTTPPTGLTAAADGSYDRLLQFAAYTDLNGRYMGCELTYNPANHIMYYTADPNNPSIPTPGKALTLSNDYTKIEEKKINFSLVNQTTYNDGGLSLDDLATVLFYDWDDTLIGVLIVPRDGDARKLVNDYVRENLIHPDLRYGAENEAEISSLAREYNYRGKYPSTPMPEKDASGNINKDDTMDGNRPKDDYVGSDYPLTNKLDYVFMKRPMEQVTTDVNGDAIDTNTWRQKGTTAESLENEEWDKNYPYVHGWARLTDDNWNNPSSMWTTVGMGELADYTGTTNGAYPENSSTGIIDVNEHGSELYATDDNFELETFDFRNHPLASGGVCSVKAVYEPGAELLSRSYSYQMISEPYYNKMNNPAAISGAAYSVDVVYERANIGIAKNLNGVTRARQLELRQETTNDLRWDNAYLENATISEQGRRTKTTYSTVPIDNVDVVNIQLILSGRQNKVNYYLVEANGSNFVTGGTRSDSNITRISTAHLVDNYNYKTADNDVDRIYYQALYEDTDNDGAVNDDRSGSYGFVLFGTINNLAQKALEHKDKLITDQTFNNFVSTDNFKDMNLRAHGIWDDKTKKWVGGAEIEYEDWKTVQSAWESAVIAARDAHEKIPADNTWWNVEQDLPQFTYHQIQLYVNDYVNNGGTATLLDADTADKQIISWCNLHEECAASRSGKPTSFAKMVEAVLNEENPGDAKTTLSLLSLDEAENLAHLRSNERGTAFATIDQLADALIAAVQGINSIKGITNTSDPELWDTVQGWILTPSSSKPVDENGLKAANQLSKDTAWWNEGENAPTTGSLAALVAAEQKAVETGRDAWINYYRYREAFTDMKTNGVSPQAQWTRLTENLVKNIDGEPFDTYEDFKTAFRTAVAQVGDYNAEDPYYWHKLQYIMAGDTRTPEADQYVKYWWHNGYSRITDLASLLLAAQQANDGNTAVWDLFTSLEDDLYGADMIQLHFRSGFNGTTDKYTDIEEFKNAVLAFVEAPGAQIATGSSNATQRNNSWNQLQYYLIHKDDDLDNDGIPDGIDLTDINTTFAYQDEAEYYWWKDGGNGEAYPLTPGVGDFNIEELDEAIYRASFNGNPKALDQLTATAAAAFRFIPSYEGSEKDWDALTKYDAATLTGLKDRLVDLAKLAGEVNCRTLTWRQIQHYLLTDPGVYLSADDPALPGDSPTDKDADIGKKNYWWKQGNANPNLGEVKNDLVIFLEIIDQYIEDYKNGTNDEEAFEEAIDLYSGIANGEGTYLNLYSGYEDEPQPITEINRIQKSRFRSKIYALVEQLADEGRTATEALDWFVLQYYALFDNTYSGGNIISPTDAQDYYVNLLTEYGLSNWAPSYVNIPAGTSMMMSNGMLTLTPAEQIESLTEQIAQLTDAIREAPEFAAEYAQEIARLMAALEELKALLEGTGEPAEPVCTCGSEDGTHAEDCPLYQPSNENLCTCGSEDGTHAEDCPLYMASGDVGTDDPVGPECTCGSEDGTHTEDCPLYAASEDPVTPEEPACTCGSEDGTHAEDCPLYVAPEDPVTPEEPVCTCGSVDGTHGSDCPLYVAPDVGTDDPVGPECTCDSQDGTHGADCPLYVAPEDPNEELTDPEVPGVETPEPDPEPEPQPEPDPEPEAAEKMETTEIDATVPKLSAKLPTKITKRVSSRLIALTNLLFDSGGWKMNKMTTQKNISPPGQLIARMPWLWSKTERGTAA